MSTLFVNNLNTASGDTITLPTGKKLVVTDTGAITAPGMIIQTVDGTDGTQTSHSSTSYTASNLSVTITPKFASSKILVGYGITTYGTVNQEHLKIQVYRSIGGATATAIVGNTWGLSAASNGTGASMNSQSNTFTDAPNTTSSTVYTVYGAPHDGGSGTGTMYFNINGARGQMFAMEIAQ